MAHHFIVLDHASDYKNDPRVFKGRNVYSTTVSHGPTRLVVWDNTTRLNPRDGEAVRYGAYGAIDGGNGKYLDPHNHPTDAYVSILLSPESSVITSNGTNTGTVASGQVYAPGRLADGDTATLSYPHGLFAEATLHFPKGHNGHGYATLEG